MPTITISTTGQASSSQVLASGTYHSSAMVLTEDARNRGAIKVDTVTVHTLPAANNGCIWSDSFQSCFPVIFKFTNGDIGLFHGNSGGLHLVNEELNRADLAEIQIFEKGNQPGNTEKVKLFSQNLVKHFEGKAKQPAINIQTVADRADYGAVICYKATDGRPVILVGKSAQLNALASTLAECQNQVDVVTAYHFEPAVNQYPPPVAVAEAAAISAANIAAQQNLRAEIRELRGANAADEPKKEPPEDTSCCVIS